MKKDCIRWDDLHKIARAFSQELKPLKARIEKLEENEETITGVHITWGPK